MSVCVVLNWSASVGLEFEFDVPSLSSIFPIIDITGSDVIPEFVREYKRPGEGRGGGGDKGHKEHKRRKEWGRAGEGASLEGGKRKGGGRKVRRGKGKEGGRKGGRGEGRGGGVRGEGGGGGPRLRNLATTSSSTGRDSSFRAGGASFDIFLCAKIKQKD